MSKKLLLLVFGCSALLSGVAVADDASEVRQLAFLIPNLYGPAGLIVESEASLPDGSTHSAHFNSAFQSSFTQFNVAFASELGALPLPSPASGFTYDFDPSTGAFKRNTHSFGPILADRAETIGKGRWSVGSSIQHFTFDKIEGLDLSKIPAVFTHDGSEAGGGKSDIVTTLTSVEATITQWTSYFTYGLTNRFDISVAVPLLAAELDLVSDATIQRVGTVELNPACDPPTANCLAVHFYDDDGEYGDHKTFASSGTASGIGDMLIRLKGTVVKGEHVGLALGMDTRLPTGDEKELLGTGAFGVRPFLALSFPNTVASPHLNFGYQWNGDSILAGNVSTGEEGDLPDLFYYVVGVDIGLGERVTLAMDILGQSVIDSPQLITSTFTARDGSTYDDIDFVEETFSTTRAALGVKTKVGKVLLSFNLLFSLDDHGLTDELTPLVGFEYSFD